MKFRPHTRRQILNRTRYKKALRFFHSGDGWYAEFKIRQESEKTLKVYLPLVAISVCYAIADIIFVLIEIFR